MNLIFVHFFPPSVVLKMPRSGFAPNRCPGDATYTVSGLLASITIRAIVCVSFSPMFVKVLPPSVVL